MQIAHLAVRNQIAWILPLVCLLLLAGCQGFGPEPAEIATATPPAAPATPDGSAEGGGETPATFEYFVSLIDTSGAPIPNVAVTIEIQGQAPLQEISDSNGYARIFVPETHAGRPGEIVIQPGQYGAYRQGVDLYPEQMPDRIQLTPLEPAAGGRRQTLTILTNGGDDTVWYVGGSDVGRFHTGEYLVAYANVTQEVEMANARLLIIAETADTLLTQAILVHPDYPLRSQQRVDGNIDMLSASELVPAESFAAGYLLGAGRVRVKDGHMLQRGDLIQAWDPQKIGGRISDYLPFSPPITMRVTSVGASGVVAAVELTSGNWPMAGTLVSLVNDSPVGASDATPTTVPTTMPAPPTPTSGVAVAAPTSTPLQVPTATDTPPPTNTPPPPPTATPAEAGPDVIATSVQATVAANNAVATNVAATFTAQAPPPAQATPAPPAAAPTSAPITAPTAPPAPASTPEFIYPQWSDSLQGWVTLRWRYAKPLPPGQSFDFILRYIDETRQRGIADAADIATKIEDYGNGEYSVYLNVSRAPAVEHYCDARYMLSIILVELNPYARIGVRSDEVQVQVAPLPGTGCD